MNSLPKQPFRRPAARLEMWGGVECSVVRTPGGNYDQLERTGHAVREDDLERFAELGLRTLRYPVLWEKHGEEPIDWSWTDRRLRRLRELGIRPIIGLLHHGCGPLPGGFLAPGFVTGLAAFARAVAARYPWIDAYTPINEPLTTARFSGLYGIWHPFHSSPESFARIFLIECQAIRAAMEAIRQINPAAQLIQTEDVGKTHATALLGYQADFENERRWLTFDFLSGKLQPDYPLWPYLRGIGISEGELASFNQRPCVPDLLGMNHYVTGERLLDERMDHYPASLQGGNGRHRYVDVPAVRAREGGVIGCGALLRELWERYERPVAITEVQLACTRDEQLRWLLEIWNGAKQAKAEGVDVHAVTAWALVGAVDWDTLLLEARGHYECGAFDVSSGEPRLTAIGRAIQHLAFKGTFEHPVLASPGWWRRRPRLLFPSVATASVGGTATNEIDLATLRPLLLVSANDATVERFRVLCNARGLRLLNVDPTSVLHFRRLEEWWPAGPPWAVVVTEEQTDQTRTQLKENLEAFCRHRIIPLMDYPEKSATTATSLLPDLNDFLDQLIDHSAQLMTMTPPHEHLIRTG